MHSRMLRHCFLNVLVQDVLVQRVLLLNLSRTGLLSIIILGNFVFGVQQAIAHSVPISGKQQTFIPEAHVANRFLVQMPPQLRNPLNPHAPDSDEPDHPIFGHLMLQTQGILEDGDEVAFQDGSLYDEYPIEGASGQHLRIHLESSEFDPYLILIGPNGNILARHDDISRDNLNATLDILLPDNGTYRVIVNGYSHYSQGRYTLSIHTTAPAGDEPLFGPSMPDDRER